MRDKDIFAPAAFGFLAGFLYLLILIAATENLPGDVYDRAVRDCKEGKVRMEITADTIYRAP